MLWTDLIELKAMLEIEPDDRSEDVRLAFWLRAACAVCEAYLDRPVYRATRTEFHKGSGTQKLLLRCRPAYADASLAVATDEQGRFGVPAGSFGSSSVLTYGVDYSLWLDHPTDPTRSDRAVLIRNSGLWNKASVRQVGLLAPFITENPGTIKVTYTGGHYAEDLPYDLVLAAVQTTARIRFMMPLGLPVNSDSYEGRPISVFTVGERNWLMGQTKHLLHNHRNRRF